MDARRLLLSLAWASSWPTSKWRRELVLSPRKRSALLIWSVSQTPLLRFISPSAWSGAALVVEVSLRRAVVFAFGEAMMFVYYGTSSSEHAHCSWVLSGRVWSDRAHALVGNLVVSWKDEDSVTLILISQGTAWRGAGRPVSSYGEARRVLRDRIEAHDIQIGGAGLQSRRPDTKDSI